MTARLARRAVASLAVATLLPFAIGAPSARAEGPRTLSSVFSSTDVGFSEGGIRTSMVDKFDGMRAYLGDRPPIVRVDLNWPGVEPVSCPGPCDAGLNWDQIDTVVDAANARDMRVLVVLAYAPSWATGHTDGGWFPTSDHDADWVDIVDATVRHLGSRVQAYEVWNEPNIEQFGDYGNALTRQQRIAERQARYWQLVRLAYPTVKHSCPSCTVLAGASSPWGDPPTAEEMTDDPNTAASWLKAGYALGSGGYFDALAYHPYPASNSGLGPNDSQCDYHFWSGFGPPFYTDPATGKKCGGELAAVREVMVSNGDSAKKIWGTEYGYPTQGAGFPYVSLAMVRNFLIEGVYMWRAVDYTGPLFIYSYMDAGVDPDEPCAIDSSSFECHMGLVTASRPGAPGTPKEPLYSGLGAALRGEYQSSLTFNQVLRQLTALRSTDGRFYLWLQGDGNLVLYQAPTATTPAVVLWKVVNKNATRLIMQADGVLVLQNGQQQPVWATDTYQGPDHTVTLVLQNDGDLVLYRDSDGRPLWDTGTWGH
jgi:polysaccharide biosynthesis protein PslG